ncbi:MAG TPA: HD domain-containing phosphohydrolase [archaeon]|nr:HD domain-containing phosphohydrolase [archaeon]
MNAEILKSNSAAGMLDPLLDWNGNLTSKVLVADDEVAIRKGLAFLLRKEGYEPLEAENGLKALKLVLSKKPDLILLDLMMPELNGLEVCTLLKSREDTRLIPVVMITAVHSQDEKIKAINAGADDFLNKPVNIAELRARVKSLLRMKHLNDLLDRSDTVIASLANAIEAKDKYTEGHNERVSRYAVTLAQAAGLSEKEQVIVRMAGILHDIGKIGVPDKVLNKRGPLDDNEFNKILSHPKKGETILAPLRSLCGIRAVVLHHHERFDGKGYPMGLMGEQIPIYARIVAIADSYDAMTTTRSYRKGLPKAEAMRELRNKAGQMWDPDLVTIFLDLLENDHKNLTLAQEENTDG